MTRTIRLLLAGAIIGAWYSAATAQTIRMSGTIEKADGNVLAPKTSDGTEVKLTLTESARIITVVKGSMADIKEGTFLGSAAMPQPDGSQKALGVHIFPEQMRGAGEGHRPYAPVPNSTMTNGTASGMTVTGVEGSTIVVKYKDGEKKIVVAPNTPILRYEIGDKSDLKAGARFTVLAATRMPDGTLETNRINVGRDGAVPQ